MMGLCHTDSHRSTGFLSLDARNNMVLATAIRCRSD